MFGSLDERELFKQLATFQIFHELGHLIASRDRARSGKLSSAQEDVEELECDDFGCSELDRAYGSSLGIEFLESIPASIFLSILLWTIAQNFSKLDDFQFRAQTFATLLRRSRAATVHVYQYGHRTEPPSERLEMDALRHFSAFEALIRILDTFFTEAVSRDSEAFYFQGLPSVTEPEARRPLAATAPEDNSPPRAPWELIWAKEDDLAEQRAKRAKTLRTAHDHRPRSRPMLSKSNSMP